MMSTTHLLIAATGLVAYTTTTHAPLSAMVWGAALFGSLAPDLDHARSLISLLTNRGWAPMLRHRHIMHSPEILPLVFWLGFHSLGAGPGVWALLYGYVTHLVADSFTEERIPMVLVFRGRYGFALMKTNGFLERLMQLGLVVGIGWMAIRHSVPGLQIPTRGG